MTEIEHDIRGDEPAEKAPRPEFAWYSQAALDVVAERRRQIEREGWSPEHDDSHDSCELAAAAACYAVCADSRQVGKLNYDGARLWPGRWLFKPKTYRANLVRASALLIAEIERLDRRDQWAATHPETTP
jgi:hypothetical protein